MPLLIIILLLHIIGRCPQTMLDGRWRRPVHNDAAQLLLANGLWMHTTITTTVLYHHHHHNRFTALFPGPPGWAGARKELLDFVVQGKINRGRHTDHPTGRHSIRANQCPPPPSPIFLQAGCPSCRPTNSVKALRTQQLHCTVLYKVSK